MSLFAGKCKAHVTCHNCEIKAGKHGKNRNGTQRFRCRQCGRTFSDQRDNPLEEMRIPLEKTEQALSLLAEGVSIRGVSRLTGLEKKTVLSLILVAGEKCRRFMDRPIRHIGCNHVQCDEIWTYVQKKQKRLTPEDPRERGDQYVFVALDPESKLVLTHRVGKRNGINALAFIDDLERCLAHRVQISTDYFRPYPEAIEDVFGSDVDYGVSVKLFASTGDAGREYYAPSRCLGSQKIIQACEASEGGCGVSFLLVQLLPGS